MIAIPQKQLLSLVTVLFGALAIIIGQFYFLNRFQQKNKSLNRTLELLEGNLVEEQKRNKLQYDSLQSEIHFQTALHKTLQAELSALEKTKAEILHKSDESKTTILRIHAVDSLRDEVSRHYRR